MPTPTSWSSVTAMPLSGIQNVDALLYDTRWASPVISYSFPGFGATWSTNPASGYGSSGSDGEPWSNAYKPLSSVGAGNDQTYFISALGKWADVANLDFVKVADTASSAGDIRAAYTAASDQSSTTAAWAYFPGATPAAADIWFNGLNTIASEHWTPGSFAFLAVMHEIGHAVGLKHPFEQTQTAGAVLPIAQDSQSYTIMSYSAKPGDETTYFSFYPTTPMVLDIAAIQYVYGVNNTHHAGDDVYAFNGANIYHETIWDAGGDDTIAYSGSAIALINLQAGSGSTLGRDVDVVSQWGVKQFSVNNVWIAYGVTIENAIGGDSDDVIMGNEAANGLTGGAGDDFLDGAGAIDTSFYAGSRSGFTISKTAAGWMVKDASLAQGTDTLVNIERLAFSDQSMALDLAHLDNAGQALEFIGLMAPGLIRAPGAVGSVLSLFDQGKSMREVCQMAIDVGLVNAIAGASTNAALAAMAYRNILGVEPDASTISGLLGYLDGRFANYTQADFMATAAQLALNQVQIDLVGLQQTGIEYI